MGKEVRVRHVRRRIGAGLLGMVVAAIILMGLWAQYMGLLYTPTDAERIARDPRAESLKEDAFRELFNTYGKNVITASNMFEAAKGRRPRQLDQLGPYGVDARQKDPWGGKFYLDVDTLRCTGNRQIARKLWSARER